MKTEFKDGDYIIATRPILEPVSSSPFGFGPAQTKEDKAYMDKPILVVKVTPTHLIYEGKTLLGDLRKWAISNYEVEKRGFVVADPALVELLNQ